MKPKKKLTNIQRETLSYIGDYQEANAGRSPSVREIAEHRGCSIGTANNLVLVLMHKGYISWHEPEPRRKIKILAAAE